MDSQRQITLFEDNDSLLEIKKHSSLVQMNNITSLQQRKTINSLIRIAKDQLKRNPGANNFSIDLWIIKKLAGISRNDNTEFKQSLKTLVSLVIEYNILGKEKYERWAFPFLSLVKIMGQRRGNTAKVFFEFPTPILEAIKRPSMYVKLNMFIRRDLNSKHSLALYEVLKDYQNIGRIRIEIEDFRKLVGIEPWQYKIVTMLRKRIIDVAVDEINEKTDLKVSYEMENKGRKITAIIFKVSGVQKHENEEEANDVITQKLHGMGIREATAKQLIERHDEDYILANIRIVEEELAGWKQIHNIPAYLMKAFEIDFRPLETEHERVKKERKANKRLEEERAGESETHKKELQKKFEKQKVKAVAKVLGELDDASVKLMKEEFLVEIDRNPLFKKILETKGLDSAPIQKQWINFIANRQLEKTASDFSEFLKNDGYGGEEAQV